MTGILQGRDAVRRTNLSCRIGLHTRCRSRLFAGPETGAPDGYAPRRTAATRAALPAFSTGRHGLGILSPPLRRTLDWLSYDMWRRLEKSTEGPPWVVSAPLRSPREVPHGRRLHASEHREDQRQDPPLRARARLRDGRLWHRPVDLQPGFLLLAPRGRRRFSAVSSLSDQTLTSDPATSPGNAPTTISTRRSGDRVSASVAGSPSSSS